MTLLNCNGALGNWVTELLDGATAWVSNPVPSRADWELGHELTISPPRDILGKFLMWRAMLPFKGGVT